jgi:hypothetical protein
LRVIPPVNLHPQLQSIYGKEGIIADEWKQYVMQTGPRQLNELVCFIKWAQDNPLANPYDLGMFPPDSFGKEVYQTDPQFRVAEWQSFILENLAALSIEKIQFYFMLYLWLMSTKEIAPNFNNTHYLKAIVDIIPRQTKAHLQANFEFFTFLDEFHWKA